MDSEEEKEKSNLRSARTSFLTRILKRPNTQPHSIRYEQTTAGPISTMPLNKHFKFLRSKTDDSMDAVTSGQPHTTPLLIRFYDPEIKAKDAAGRTLDDILDWSDKQLEQCHNYIQMLFPLPEGSPYNFEAPVITRQVLEAFRGRPELRGRLRESFARILDFYGFDVKGEEFDVEDEDEVENEVQEEGTAEGNANVVQETETEDQPDLTVNATAEGTPASATEQSIDQAPETSAAAPHSTTPADEPTEQSKLDATEATAQKTASSQQKHISLIPPPVQVVRAPHWRPAFRNWAVRFDHNHLRITRILRCLRVLGLQDECEAYYLALREVYNDPEIHINERSMRYWKRAIEAPLYLAPDEDTIPWLKRWEEEKAAEEKEKKAALHAEET